MFHDSMYDLHSFLNLSGFKQWHKHQYLSESKEFLKTKKYFADVHNKILDIGNPGEPKLVVSESWYGHTRLDVTPQVIKQYVESSFNAYRSWEEESCTIYESCASELLSNGNVSDFAWVQKLIEDVQTELKDIYECMLKLRYSNYDSVFILDLQKRDSEKVQIVKDFLDGLLRWPIFIFVNKLLTLKKSIDKPKNM